MKSIYSTRVHRLTHARIREKGREGKEGRGRESLSLLRASLGDARHEIFKIQMATRIRSRALRLIRNFLNSNAFKLAPPLLLFPFQHSITRIFFLAEDHCLLYVFFSFLSIDGKSNFTSGKLIISSRSRTIEFLSRYSS